MCAHRCMTTARTERGPADDALRNALVVAEIALASALLVTAGLLARSFVSAAARREKAGFRPEHVLTGHARDRRARSYPIRRVCGRLLCSASSKPLAALPGVTAGRRRQPIRRGRGMRREHRHGHRRAQDHREHQRARYHVATPRWHFEAPGIPLAEGRLIDDRDQDRPPMVIVVNQALRVRLLPGASPRGGPGSGFVGRRTAGSSASSATSRTRPRIRQPCRRSGIRTRRSRSRR